VLLDKLSSSRGRRISRASSPPLDATSGLGGFMGKDVDLDNSLLSSVSSGSGTRRRKRKFAANKKRTQNVHKVMAIVSGKVANTKTGS
jgi:hypothetical protein